jgi:predicted anti-sigma-YlaC factor YlaD
MNQQPCEYYIEWMSLAQDGMLSSTQTHLLHAHLAGCPTCQIQWEAMTRVSKMFRAAPVVSPQPGFVGRFQARLAYREERRRQLLIWTLLSVGVLTLSTLALPSILTTLRITGQLVLPHQVLTYIRGLVNWLAIVFNALADTAWLLLRHWIAQPASLACIGSAALAGLLSLFWVRVLWTRTGARKAHS